MSTISASTTSTTAYKVVADTTGTLVLQTGSTPTTAVTISSAQIVTFANPPTATGAGSVSTNTAYGTSALAANTSGSQNTAIGYQAGATETTATNLTAVGHQAANSATGSGIVAVGTSAAFAASGNDHVAIGAAALLTNSSGTNNTAVGRSALRFNTTASNSTAVGYEAAYNSSTGSLMTAVGRRALYSSTVSNYSVAIGADALYNWNNTSTDGSSVAVGYQALITATTANNNTAVGHQAGYSHTTAGTCTFIGTSSGYSTTGGSNTFVGCSSGESVTSGANNTIIGRYNGNQGGLDIRTASNYIVLSDGNGNPRASINQYGTLVMQAGSTVPGVNSNLVGTIHIGNGSMGAVSVNPTVFFGNAYSSSAGVPVYCGNWPATNNWGIGLHDGSASRNIRIGGTTQGTGGQQWDGAYANIYAGSYTNASDYRIKENVVGLDDGALASVLALRPVKYRIKKIEGDEQENRTEIGFIAHEVQEHIPEVVIGEKDAVDGGGNEQHQGVDYAKLTAVLAKAIQEQQAIIETLTNRITALEAK